MEFSGQYLTYQEYLALGGTLDLMPFNLIEFEARKQIDIRTQNRLVDCEKAPQSVKLCEYNLINMIDGYAKSTNNITSKGITSESIDGYSISYVSPTQISEVVKSKNSEITDTIRTYLLNEKYNDEHLLFIGVK